MFGKKEDVTRLKEAAVFSKEKASDLNTEVDLVVRANSFSNHLFPTPGKMAVGNRGIDFRADSGRGYIQIPWTSVEGVEVDIPAGNYVRSIKVATKETQPLEFVVNDGKNLVRELNKRIGREKLSSAPQNIQSAGCFLKDKIKSFFKKGSSDKKKS